MPAGGHCGGCDASGQGTAAASAGAIAGAHAAMRAEHIT